MAERDCITFPCDKAVELSTKIEGWMDRDELVWLYETASSLRDKSVWVEVGCWKGRSAMSVLFGLPTTCRFHAVDNWQGDPDSPAHWEAREIPGWLLANFGLVLSVVFQVRGRLMPLVHRHNKGSLEVAAEIPDKSIDVVFLDARHDYQSVSEDLAAWLPKLKAGGMVSGHDIDRDGVLRAVAEKFPRWQRGPKNIWYAGV